MTEPIDIAAGRREAEEAIVLGETASEGPWHGSAHPTKMTNGDNRYDHVVWGPSDLVCTSGVNEKRQALNGDTEFIADARSSVPSLAEKLLAAYDEIEQLRSDNLSIDRLRSLVIEFASRRSAAHHRRGSDADLRQQGELNMLNHVLDALNGGALIEDWLTHS